MREKATGEPAVAGQLWPHTCDLTILFLLWGPGKHSWRLLCTILDILCWGSSDLVYPKNTKHPYPSQPSADSSSCSPHPRNSKGLQSFKLSKSAWPSPPVPLNLNSQDRLTPQSCTQGPCVALESIQYPLPVSTASLSSSGPFPRPSPQPSQAYPSLGVNSK